jgi:hypothetical protein
MSEIIRVELTQDEAEILCDLIGDYSDYMRKSFGTYLNKGMPMEYRGEEIEKMNAFRLRILKALEEHENEDSD